MGTTIISTSNSVYNYTGSWLGYYFYLEVILNSQSIANNTSNITVNHYGQANTSTGGGYSGFSTPSSTITVQGSNKRTGACDANIPTSGTKVLLGTWTGDVAHASDGTLSLTVSASYAPNTSSYSYLPQANTLSKTVSVATIPRASAISLNVSSYTVSASSGNAFQWTITPQTNTFWNKLRWTLGNVDTSSQKGQGTSSGYFTNQELLSALPNAKSGTLTVYCYTYSDANYSNLVGTKSVSITVSVSLKPSAPTLTTIGFRNRSSGVNSNITTPTAGYTTVALTAWSHGTAYGAGSYTTYFSVNQGATLKTSSATANNTVIETNTLPSSAKQYTLTMTAYTIDSRGNQSNNSTITCAIYGYQPPVASLQAFRTSSSSSTTEDGAGTWARVLFSNSLRGQTDTNGALISNNQNLVVSATCTRSGYSSGSCTSGYNYALPDTGTMTFTYTVTDRFTTSRATVTVPTASYPLDLYDDGNGNVGVGLGTIAKANVVTTPLQIISPTWQTRIMICDVTDAEVKAQDSTLTTSSADNLWFQALLKAICVKYPSVTTCRFIGKLTPNSIRSYDVTIYDTSAVSNGLPRYSFGYYIAYGGASQPFRTFGTSEYQYFWTDGIPRAVYANSAGSATNADFSNATGVTNLFNTVRTTVDLNSMNAYAGGTQPNRSSIYEPTAEASNRPANAYGFVLTLRGADVNYGAQLWLGENTIGMFYRPYLNQTWSSWRRIELSTTLWTGSLTGGKTLNLTVSSYRRLRVFTRLYAVNAIYEIDLDGTNAHEQISGYRYSNGCSIAEYTASGGLEYLVSQSMVNTAKTVFRHYHCGYQAAGGSYVSRDGNSEYYVYRIDGII